MRLFKKRESGREALSKTEKIRRAVRQFDGVEDVEADMSANKLTVIGKVDPAKVREKLADKIKKNVELVSPQPKKDVGGDKKKPEEKGKAEAKKSTEEVLTDIPVGSWLVCLLLECNCTVHATVQDIKE